MHIIKRVVHRYVYGDIGIIQEPAIEIILAELRYITVVSTSNLKRLL